MSQSLTVKVNNPDGSESIKIVSILRSWQDAAGNQIFLHSNGTYGYKDGAPVRDVRELDVIASLHHRQAAVGWWQRAGKVASVSYYAAMDEHLAAMAGQHEGAAQPQADLDLFLYHRCPVTDGPSEEMQGPFTWMELFASCPDWWGVAKTIGFDDHTYYLSDDAENAVLVDEPGEVPQKVFEKLAGEPHSEKPWISGSPVNPPDINESSTLPKTPQSGSGKGDKQAKNADDSKAPTDL